jgi:hypothetical protein
VTSAAYSVHPALAIAAEATLPALGLLAIVLPTIEWRAGRLKYPELFLLGSLVSFALVYIIRYASHASGHWLGTGLRYSTHAAVAVSIGVTLAACRLSLLPAVAVLVAGYLWLITYLPYHTPGDVLSTIAVMLPLTLLCHLPRWRRGTG